MNYLRAIKVPPHLVIKIEKLKILIKKSNNISTMSASLTNQIQKYQDLKSLLINNIWMKVIKMQNNRFSRQGDNQKISQSKVKIAFKNKKIIIIHS